MSDPRTEGMEAASTRYAYSLRPLPPGQLCRQAERAWQYAHERERREYVRDYCEAHDETLRRLTRRARGRVA